MVAGFWICRKDFFPLFNYSANHIELTIKFQSISQYLYVHLNVESSICNNMSKNPWILPKLLSPVNMFSVFDLCSIPKTTLWQHYIHSFYKNSNIQTCSLFPKESDIAKENYNENNSPQQSFLPLCLHNAHTLYRI